MRKILSLIICLLIALSLCACGSKNSPSSSVDEYMKTKKNEAAESLDQYLNEEDLSMLGGSEETAKDFYNLLADFDYSTSNEKIEEDKAYVDVTFKTYDFGTFMKNFIADYFQDALAMAFSGATEEELAEKSAEIFNTRLDETKKAGKTIENTITVTLDKVEDKWVVNEEESGELLASAILGGMLEALESLGSAFE